ncbi:iron-containing alcohol dehydrogenase [Planctomycetota bacterium]|nr:iron-containing alcohol dehydrogenase [Planctomycetota bacterium]
MPIAPSAPAGVTQFNFPTRIRFGAGAVKELPALLAELGVTKPLLVTDGGLVKTDAYARTIAALGDTPHGVYSGVTPNPLAEQVDQAAAQYAADGCNGVVGLGGGSALDVAKVVGVVAKGGGVALDYDWAVSGSDKIPAELPPFVAIPTTAGTGSEVGRSAVITNPATKTKRSVFAAQLLAVAVLADPELTLGLPASVTANTGIDALTHAIEAYLTPGFNPMCDGIALQAIGMVGGALRRAVGDGSDLEARSTMMCAALMAAVAFQKGLGATHALAHPLSTLAGLPHGRANALCLPAVLRFNAVAVPDRVNAVGQALADTNDAAVAVRTLCDDVGIPANLAAAGVSRDLLDALCEQAGAEFLLGENPRVVTPEDIRALYLEAFGD